MACETGGALLLQSSGSTGRPKIVRRSAEALDAVGENCRRTLRMGPGDRMLVAIPASHSYGIDHAMLAAPLAAAAVELHERFDPETVARRLADESVTLMPGVPSIYEALAASEDGAGAAPRRNSSLRHAYSAGGPLPESVWNAFRERFGVPIGQIYGSTEFASVTFNDPGVAPFDPSSVGRPMAGVDLRILDVETPDVHQPLETGRVGQVAVRAPSMSDGYVNDAEPPTREGYFLSGDLGCLDEHGRLHIQGRLKLLIDVGGRKIDPLEIEAVLAEHPEVGEAVVVPIGATATVNRLKAVVTPAQQEAQQERSPDPEALRRWVRQRLSRHKVPRIFEVRADLPRTSLGKIRRDAVEPSSS
jgi:acyl-CoA synthetase (AMP-forming)/AMP-acid ligase II